MMSSSSRLDDALQLARTIIADLDGDASPLSRIAQKCERLGRLLEDEKSRAYFDSAVQTIGASEAGLTSAEQSATHAAQSDNAFDSPHWYQTTIVTHKNELVAWRRSLASWAKGVYNGIQFSAAPADVFSRIRERVDARIARLLPDAVQHLTSVYANLRSANAEDWANAVHGCRRLLKRVADHFMPASEDPRLTDEKFINRLVEWIAQNSSSDTFSKIVGSHLDFIGDRIDAVYKASTKGSHANVGLEEAERYVLYTYILVGDILALAERSDP